LKEIKALTPKTICEEGCGVGTISSLLDIENKELFDIDDDMIKLTKINTQGKIYKADILKKVHSKKLDIIFSHGVLEHFDDNDIRTIISRQREQAKNVLHYVPTNKYKYKSFGTERLMSIERWGTLVRPNKIIQFNQDKDAILIW
jgi:sialic acid synthase SpsE